MLLEYEKKVKVFKLFIYFPHIDLYMAYEKNSEILCFLSFLFVVIFFILILIISNL